MPSPHVAAVVLNWNNGPDTVDCLASLARVRYDRLSVLVVDNGSRDDSVAQIRAACPGVDLLLTGSNLGFAEGNNVGLRQVLAGGADYALVLNNDTVVDPLMVSHLVEAAEADPSAGLCGPTICCHNGGPTDTLFSVGSTVLWAQGDLQHHGLFQPAESVSLPAAARPADFVVGCCVLARRSCLDAIGLLNPDYYLNFEDVEWCVEAWRGGYRVLHVPPARLWHKISATLGFGSPANTYYMTRNALLFFRRNSPRRLRPVALARILARTVRAVGAWSVWPRYRSDLFRRKRAANLLAMRDFVLGRFGAMGADVAAVCYPVAAAPTTDAPGPGQ